MSALTWDTDVARQFKMGVSKTVLFPYENGTYSNGVAWSGVINITNTPDGAEATELWADNIKYGEIRSTETLALSLEAYTSPAEFDECDGTVELTSGVSIGQQTRKKFGLSWRTEIGDGTSQNAGYMIYLAYGCTASPAEESYDTINDSPDAETLSWDISTTPVSVTGHKSTALVKINSLKVDATKLAALEQKLYGSSTVEPTLLTPDEVLALFSD